MVLLLIAHPLGKFLAYSLPFNVYRLPRILGGAQFSLNPGPWNIKEHVLVFIMTNVSVGPAYALNAVVVAEFYYKLRLGFWFNVVLILATQLTGFGLAGLCRRFLVWPASMVWPQNLLTCTLLNTLHAEEDENAGISRFRYFMYVFTGSFFFFFLPGYLFQALSVFSWICWIAPNNIPLNQVFGVASGLGMSVLTFDWTAIEWIGNPFMIPWWAEVHIFVGFVIFYWIITPILYYTNVGLPYFPHFRFPHALLDVASFTLPDVRHPTIRPLRQYVQRVCGAYYTRHVQPYRLRGILAPLSARCVRDDVFSCICPEHMCDCAHSAVPWPHPSERVQAHTLRRRRHTPQVDAELS